MKVGSHEFLQIGPKKLLQVASHDLSMHGTKKLLSMGFEILGL